MHEVANYAFPINPIIQTSSYFFMFG